MNTLQKELEEIELFLKEDNEPQQSYSMDNVERQIRVRKKCEARKIEILKQLDNSQHPRNKQDRGGELKPCVACDKMDNGSPADALSQQEVKK